MLSQTAWCDGMTTSASDTLLGTGIRYFCCFPRLLLTQKALSSFSHLKCEERHRTALSDESLGSVQGFTSSSAWLVLMQEVGADLDGFKGEESLNA